MEKHQQRVVEEKAELDQKIEKLSDFIDGAVFAAIDTEGQKLLRAQHILMQGYSSILRKRIQSFD